ncbi:hypothetical protein EYC84_003059 [Monilinia fructicola]|uniref:Uncharacterized protein n=1 Tax=Monilinia fructicola TaxID=38448 RepID=A0A5M9JWF6_MONFR|nr:hypothetical protein EYC84_003059 [Monilinia fructicola]
MVAGQGKFMGFTAGTDEKYIDQSRVTRLGANKCVGESLAWHYWAFQPSERRRAATSNRRLIDIHSLAWYNEVSFPPLALRVVQASLPPF